MLEKVKTVDELKPLIAILRATGKKIVFTNGCFDLIHTGHTRYLAQAKSCGDVLIVAVNSDASVRAIKGEKGPSIPRRTASRPWRRSNRLISSPYSTSPIPTR